MYVGYVGQLQTGSVCVWVVRSCRILVSVTAIRGQCQDTRTPGHGHRAIVETMLICIVIHFNIAMDSGSASILLI